MEDRARRRTTTEAFHPCRACLFDATTEDGAFSCDVYDCPYVIDLDPESTGRPLTPPRVRSGEPSRQVIEA